MTPPARLSQRERNILALLAAGHTAKSAAAELGLSVNAVNERLREARRKTGAGSSRELARALAAAPEACDEEIGVEASPEGAPSSAAGHMGRRRGAQPMSLLAGAGAVAASVAVGVAVVHSLAVAAPHVVGTDPAQGAIVGAGPMRLAVTFDRPMRADSYSFVRVPGAAYPDCASAPTVSADRRTFSLACVLRSHMSYGIGFNSVRFRNFVSAADSAAAETAVLRFSTH